MSNQPKSKFSPKTEKVPRIQIDNKNINSQNPTWKFCLFDLEGAWSWFNISSKEKIKEIIDKITNFESMTWKEILGDKNHLIEIKDLIKDAVKRLEKLQIEDIETLLSLRLSNTERIWGIKTGNVCKLLWWDPKHEICPSKKKHT